MTEDRQTVLLAMMQGYIAQCNAAWYAREFDSNVPEPYISMDRETFFEVADLWACTYYCGPTKILGSGTKYIATEALRSIAQEMREGSFFWIDGRRVPVVEVV